jgi:hypothetical protein
MQDNQRLGTCIFDSNSESLVIQGLRKNPYFTTLPERISECFVPGFLIRAIQQIPFVAGARRELNARWRKGQSGIWAELIGANRLFEMPSSGVIAVVHAEARLVLASSKLEIALPSGIWRVAPLA